MKSTLCSLNKREGRCVPDESIDVDLLASKYKCSGSSESKELCVMESLGDSATIAKYFKPITKSFDSNHWLNNTEIDHVQYQLMLNYPGYYYSNIHMIDLGMFDPSNKDIIDFKPIALTDLDFVAELKGKGHLKGNGPLETYGIVVNTDVSTGGGIHWFAIFMDFRSTPMTIEYFNSSGYNIKKKDFKLFFIKLADDISMNVGKCEFLKVSDIQHQSSDTSNCGVYALYYIWKRLGGTPIEYFKKNKVTDDSIVLFRKYFFRLSTQA